MDSAARRYLEGFAAGSLVRAARGGSVRVPPTSIPQPADLPPPATTFQELAKQQVHPLDAFPGLLNCAETNTPPDPADQFRFQWFGLTYLGPAKDGFRLRLRVPGGTLRTSQLREVAGIARDCASGSLKINPYAGLDLETVNVSDAPEALRRAEVAGLTGRGTGGDQVAVLSSRLAGLDPDEAIDVGPFVTRLEECLLAGREFADLPNSCVIVFRSSDQLDADNLPPGDIRLTAQMRPVVTRSDSSVSFTLEVAPLGDLETALRPDQVVHSCLELIRWYKTSTDRSVRERTTWSAFCGAWSKRRCLETLESRLGTKLPRHDPHERGPSTNGADFPPVGMHVRPQRNSGHSIVEVEAPSSSLLSAQWEQIAHVADTLGCGRIRLGTRGTVVLPGVLPTNVGCVQEELRRITRSE